MTGGRFLKRSKLPIKDPSSGVVRAIEPQDLFPGCSVPMVGRDIIITDADKFTRDYFRYT